MVDYTKKSYGRNGEVNTIYKMFAADRDVSMHGPRRLGKTFVLDRLVDEGSRKGFLAIKVDSSVQTPHFSHAQP